MRAGNDMDFYLRLLIQFYQDHRDYPERIRALLEAGNRSAASQTAHMLVGIALNLGADALGNSAREVEQAIGTADADLETALTALSAAITTLGQAIAGLRPADDTPGVDGLDSDALRDQLRELDALLDERNMRARQHFEALLPRVADPQVRACLETAGGRSTDSTSMPLAKPSAHCSRHAPNRQPAKRPISRPSADRPRQQPLSPTTRCAKSS
jgi:HPt (histidine-containing phosphotransfer) domain-containing protein